MESIVRMKRQVFDPVDAVFDILFFMDQERTVPAVIVFNDLVPAAHGQEFVKMPD